MVLSCGQIRLRLFEKNLNYNMWSYYGTKTSSVDFYPPPKHDVLIEPFAGAAKYALKYFEKEVIILDRYPLIVDIWKWLQKCSPADVLKLPSVKYGEHVDAYSYDCKEARDLIGFMVGFSTSYPRRTGTIRMKQRPNYINYQLKSIASQLFKIKHWDIRQGTYSDIYNRKATWFIDPPYQGKGGNKYKFGTKTIDYEKLAKWCISRKGQTIVCDSKGADYLPFKFFKNSVGSRGIFTEMIWSNEIIASDNEQLKLIL